MTTEVRNPVFARTYAWMRPREPDEQVEYRRETLRGLSGRVLDLGAGDGGNFEHYPQTVSEVVAVEPEPYLRERAERNARNGPVPVTVVDGMGDDVPLEDASVDAAVTTLVLCTVPDQAATLRELRRVVRPGGELRFFEHVVARGGPLRGVQRFLDRTGLWALVGGGCHVSRDTAAAIEAAGFEIERLRRVRHVPCPLVFPVAPHIVGAARRPADQRRRLANGR